MLARGLPRDERFDAILPVPMHWWRRWKRGFNQSELLAAAISRSTAAPVLRELVRRRRTPPQAGLSLEARQDNVKESFRVRRRERVKGKRILLVDDVMTTGSTATACAVALKKAGAASVVLLTLARVDRRWAETPIDAGVPGAS